MDVRVLAKGHGRWVCLSFTVCLLRHIGKPRFPGAFPLQKSQERIPTSFYVRPHLKIQALIAEIDDTISEQETTLPDGSLATLRLCMDKLSKADRVLVQDFYGGMPAKNIAQQNDRSVEGVYNSLCRVRRSLLECIRRTEEGERK